MTIPSFWRNWTRDCERTVWSGWCIFIIFWFILIWPSGFFYLHFWRILGDDPWCLSTQNAVTAPPFFTPSNVGVPKSRGPPFFPTLADHFRLSRVEISWTNFLPSSLSCETSKPLKFHKSLVLLFFFFFRTPGAKKTTKQAETTSRLRHQAEFLFKSKYKVNWYEMSSLSLIHWWSCCFLCDTGTIPVVSWIFLAAWGGGFESPEVTVGTRKRHGGRSRRGEARRSSKIGPLGLVEKMCYNRPGVENPWSDHEIWGTNLPCLFGKKNTWCIMLLAYKFEGFLSLEK